MNRFEIQNVKSYQFRIELWGIEPLIWRSFQVPGNYTMWELHVAIQDVMGWRDSHLHLFEFTNMLGKREIGIPESDEYLRSWDCYISDWFYEKGAHCMYIYDFGDNWKHRLIVEDIKTTGPKIRKPKCLKGERSCPPENIGGFSGYYTLVDQLENPDNWTREEIKERVGWLKRCKYYPYNPNHFNKRQVVFEDPASRLSALIGEINQ
jgi:hypothetical protein